MVRIGKLVTLKAKKRRLTVNVTLQTYDMYHVCPFNFGITDKKQKKKITNITHFFKT